MIKKAQEKYGIENFEKEILKICNSREEMFDMESQIVNEDFVKSKQTYNVLIGGVGGPKEPKDTDYYQSGEHTQNVLSAQQKAIAKHQELKKQRIDNYYNDPNLCAQCNQPLKYEKKKNKFCSSSCAATFNNTGRVVSENQKQKVSEANKAKRKVSDKQLLEALTQSVNIVEAFNKVELSKTPNNYKRARELINAHNLTNIKLNTNQTQIQETKRKKQLILNSDIDFTKHGWVKKVALLLGCKQTNHAGIWIRKHMPEFYKNCYRRKTKS